MMTNVIEMDFMKFFELIEKNVGRRIVMEFVNRKSQQLKKITGVIKTAFSQEYSPVCIIETAETKEEVFADEVRQLDLL
jgi:predicted site-specific integrase-resolvase